MSMYAEDTTLYTSATTETAMTATLNKEVQLVSEWVVSNKLVLNISKTKLLGVTLSWSKHIDTTLAKMGRSLSIIKRYSAF